MKQQVRQHLTDLQIILTLHRLWDATPPSDAALNNDQPFCIGTLSATQWLQWVFIPRMNALLDANAELPRNFAITPYLSEALKDHPHLAQICAPLTQLETLLKN